MSRVTCPLSPVTCHMSPVTCPKNIGQSGGASRWRVCYQRGLTRLVFEDNTIQPPSSVHEPWCQILFTTSKKNLYYSNNKFTFFLLNSCPPNLNTQSINIADYIPKFTWDPQPVDSMNWQGFTPSTKPVPATSPERGRTPSSHRSTLSW